MALAALSGSFNLRGNEENNNSTFEFLQNLPNIACS